jgi:hypothetical protein
MSYIHVRMSDCLDLEIFWYHVNMFMEWIFVLYITKLIWFLMRELYKKK